MPSRNQVKGGVDLERVEWRAVILMQDESIRINDDNNMLKTIDVNMFLSWVQAASENQTGRMVFLKDRFRDELRPAFDT